MNDLMLRAAVGAQTRAAHARAFVARKMRPDNGDGPPVVLIIGIIGGIIVLAGIVIGTIVLGNRTTTCLENAKGLTLDSTSLTC